MSNPKHLLPLTESDLFRLELILEAASLNDDLYSPDERSEIQKLLKVVVRFNMEVLG